MPTDVVMPQMGESIAEGTVIRWIKKVGDKVERDEPLLEISTDKVDAEIPSPAAGVLTEILAQEGQTVAVNSVVARLSGEGGATASAPQPAAQQPQKPAPAPAPSFAPQAKAAPAQAPRPAPPQQQAANAAAREDIAQQATGVGGPAAASALRPQPSAPSSEGDRNVTSLEERRRTKSSPLVRKIAHENDVDISQIQGSGVSGRVTKRDILEFLDHPQGEEMPQAAPSVAGAAPRPARPASFAEGESVRIEPLSVMRKKIAHHMILSKQTSAHVTTVFEVDFTNIEKLRKRYKDEYAERGVKITYLPFIVQAVIAGLREFPIINASMDENSIIYHREMNIGIAVALEWGLIVPVLKNADEKNILGMARAINDLGERARSKKLSPDDVQGGTFTITNPGIYGGLFGTPIINQPQVAILGVGGVKKRPVVVESKDGDSIAIRSMCILALTFDHRLVDGAVADQFMAGVKRFIEAGQFTL
jgi:pyruvate dehydrogenase E2 component (dihydrolipoamide acetyltransferase)